MANNQSKKTFSFNPSLNMSIDPNSGMEEVVPDIPTPQAATPLLDPTKGTPEASAITPESLANEVPLDMPFKETPVVTGTTTEQPAAETPVDAMLANADQVIEDEKLTKEQQLGGDITQKLFDAVGETRGEFEDRAKADLAGKEGRRELLAINNKIKALNAEIAQDDITLINNQRNEEVRDTLLPFARSNQAKLAGDAAILRALKTSQKGVLVAEAMAKQGDITLAINEANAAVDAKYAPYKEDIAIYTAQLEVLLPTLNAQEKKQAAALLRKQKLADDKIDRLAEEEKGAMALSMIASSNNQGVLASQFAALDPDSETFKEDRSRLISKLNDPVFDLEMKIKKNTLNSQIAAAESAKIAAEKGYLTKDQLKTATDLRKERNNLAEVKDAKDLEPNTTALLSSLAQENGVGDIAAINAFQRLAVDPGVAVREGDVALLQSAQSFGDIAFLKTQGLFKGDKLTVEARAEMKELVAQIHDSRIGFVEDNTAQIRTVAEESGIDYDKYIGKSFTDFETIEARVNEINQTPEEATESYLNNMFGPEAQAAGLLPFGVTRN